VAGTVLAAPFPAVLRGLLDKTRSKQRIVHSEIDVKRWMAGPPSCAAARPSCCPACKTASREPGRNLALVGHGLRLRTLEGPLAPDSQPTAAEIHARRYRCRSCEAIIVVVPRGVARRYRYTLAAIALALALWAYERLPAAGVRARSSTVKCVGDASATRWASLRRWTRCAVSLFGTAAELAGTLRERAARIATFVASHAPIATGRVSHDAFHGAAFCASR
jgi:hypothetical protein